ncbi:hypothetical protein KIPB_006172, partial [Kipferlia bialata]
PDSPLFHLTDDEDYRLDDDFVLTDEEGSGDDAFMLIPEAKETGAKGAAKYVDPSKVRERKRKQVERDMAKQKGKKTTRDKDGTHSLADLSRLVPNGDREMEGEGEGESMLSQRTRRAKKAPVTTKARKKARRGFNYSIREWMDVVLVTEFLNRKALHEREQAAIKEAAQNTKRRKKKVAAIQGPSCVRMSSRVDRLPSLLGRVGVRTGQDLCERDAAMSDSLCCLPGWWEAHLTGQYREAEEVGSLPSIPLCYEQEPVPSNTKIENITFIPAEREREKERVVDTPEEAERVRERERVVDTPRERGMLYRVPRDMDRDVADDGSVFGTAAPRRVTYNIGREHIQRWRHEYALDVQRRPKREPVPRHKAKHDKRDKSKAVESVYPLSLHGVSPYALQRQHLERERERREKSGEGRGRPTNPDTHAVSLLVFKNGASVPHWTDACSHVASDTETLRAKSSYELSLGSPDPAYVKGLAATKGAVTPSVTKGPAPVEGYARPEVVARIRQLLPRLVAYPPTSRYISEGLNRQPPMPVSIVSGRRANMLHPRLLVPYAGVAEYAILDRVEREMMIQDEHMLKVEREKEREKEREAERERELKELKETVKVESGIASVPAVLTSTVPGTAPTGSSLYLGGTSMPQYSTSTTYSACSGQGVGSSILSQGSGVVSQEGVLSQQSLLSQPSTASGMGVLSQPSQGAVAPLSSTQSSGTLYSGVGTSVSGTSSAGVYPSGVSQPSVVTPYTTTGFATAPSVTGVTAVEVKTESQRGMEGEVKTESQMSIGCASSTPDVSGVGVQGNTGELEVIGEPLQPALKRAPEGVAPGPVLSQQTEEERAADESDGEDIILGGEEGEREMPPPEAHDEREGDVSMEPSEPGAGVCPFSLPPMPAELAAQLSLGVKDRERERHRTLMGSTVSDMGTETSRYLTCFRGRYRTRASLRLGLAHGDVLGRGPELDPPKGQKPIPCRFGVWRGKGVPSTHPSVSLSQAALRKERAREMAAAAKKELERERVVDQKGKKKAQAKRRKKPVPIRNIEADYQVKFEAATLAAIQSSVHTISLSSPLHTWTHSVTVALPETVTETVAATVPTITAQANLLQHQRRQFSKLFPLVLMHSLLQPKLH